MRMSRGTIGLVVALILVIAAVLLLNNNPATAPGENTPVATNVPVALLPGVNDISLARMEVRDNTTGQRTVLSKSDVDSPWSIEGGEGSAGAVDSTGGDSQPADAAQIAPIVGLLSTLQSAEGFESEQLGDYGLRNPQFTILVTTYEGAVFLMHIGSQSPTNPRYYVIVEQASGATDISPIAEGTDAIGGDIVEPGEQMGGAESNQSGGVLLEDITAEVTPITDLTQAAVLSELIEATNAAVGTQIAQAAATADAAATEAPSQDAEGMEAIGTQDVQPGEQVGGGSESNQLGGVSLEDVTLEATVDVTAEATLSPEPTLEPTLGVLAEPLVALDGSFQIYLVQKTTIDRILAFIVAPPVAVPTLVPTFDPLLPLIPIPEATLEATIEATAEGN